MTKIDIERCLVENKASLINKTFKNFTELKEVLKIDLANSGRPKENFMIALRKHYEFEREGNKLIIGECKNKELGVKRDGNTFLSMMFFGFLDLLGVGIRYIPIEQLIIYLKIVEYDNSEIEHTKEDIDNFTNFLFNKNYCNYLDMINECMSDTTVNKLSLVWMKDGVEIDDEKELELLNDCENELKNKYGEMINPYTRESLKGKRPVNSIDKIIDKMDGYERMFKVYYVFNPWGECDDLVDVVRSTYDKAKTAYEERINAMDK